MYDETEVRNMKFRTKLLAILFIAIPLVSYGATYTLVSATYPVN